MSKDCKKGRSNCHTSMSLEIIGDTWSLIVVRGFIFEGKRDYSELIDLIEGISSNILIDRLKWLTINGIFTKHQHPTNKKKKYYEITNKGFDLIIVIMELARWGWKYFPDSLGPPEIKELFLNNPKEFIKYWKKQVNHRSQEYINEAEK